MTEAEWLGATDPTPMLEFMKGKASDRKFRLFAVACCRRVWHVLTDDRSRRAVELADQAADGAVSERTLDAVSGEAEEAFEDAITDHDDTEREDNPGVTAAQYAAACSAASYASNTPVVRLEDAVVVANATSEAVPDPSVMRGKQASVLRDIFGNPFRPVTVDPSWLTSNVLALAEGIYADRAFDRMPILADALQDAGCDNEDVLTHCRSEGPHCRGCWAVDLLLGKE